MKKILLMRHSIAQKCELPTEQLPLSEQGIQLAQERKTTLSRYAVNKAFCSDYKRAQQTAEILVQDVTVIKELQERRIGNAKEDFWHRQYLDHSYKNEDGESLQEVSLRMQSAIQSILHEMRDGECALVVSHATAICSYLMAYCDVEVTDASKKLRRITKDGSVIMDGSLDPASFFEIAYESDQMHTIVFHGCREC